MAVGALFDCLLKIGCQQWGKTKTRKAAFVDIVLLKWRALNLTSNPVPEHQECGVDFKDYWPRQ
jgi:hypothetical protein